MSKVSAREKNAAPDYNTSTTVCDSREYTKRPGHIQKFSSKWKVGRQSVKNKGKVDTDNEGMISDNETEPEMSEEYVLKCLGKEL